MASATSSSSSEEGNTLKCKVRIDKSSWSPFASAGPKLAKDLDPNLLAFVVEVRTNTPVILPNAIGAAVAMKSAAEPSATAAPEFLFRQWHSLGTVQRLWEHFLTSFRGCVLPPLQVRATAQFSETKQRLWHLEYALNCLACGSDGAMVLLEPYVKFFRDGRLCQSQDPDEKVYEHPPMVLEPKQVRFQGQGEEGVKSPQAFRDPSVGSDGGPSSPTGAGPSQVGSMHQLALRLQNLAKNTFRKPPSVRSHRDLLASDLLGKFHDWQKAAHEISHLASRIGDLTSEYWRRTGTGLVPGVSTVGPSGGVSSGVAPAPPTVVRQDSIKAIKAQVGRLRIHGDVELGQRVENIQGNQGTVVYLGDLKDNRGIQMIGVCWDEAGVGYCDGSFSDGNKYFHCQNGKGSFTTAVNLFHPVDEDDVISTLSQASALLDGLLFPNEALRIQVVEVGCQLTSLLQYYSAFIQSTSNHISELLTVHHALLTGESWLAAEVKGDNDRSAWSSKAREVGNLIDMLTAEWWVAFRALEDSHDAFRKSKEWLRGEIASLMSRFFELSDFGASTRENELLQQLSNSMLDPNDSFDATGRTLHLARMSFDCPDLGSKSLETERFLALCAAATETAESPRVQPVLLTKSAQSGDGTQ